MRESEGLRGQWVGTYEGSVNGAIVINIDEEELNCAGEAYLVHENAAPHMLVYFTTANKDLKFRFRTSHILWFDSTASGGFGGFVSLDEIAAKFQGAAFSKYADVEGECKNDTLTLSWNTDIGTSGKCVLPRSEADKPSTLQSMDLNWAGYKEHVSALTTTRSLFRGQHAPFRKVTASTVYRTGHSDAAQAPQRTNKTFFQSPNP